MQQPVSQVAVDAATQLIDRFDLVLEDMQNAMSMMLRASEGAEAMLAGRETVKCTRCGVSVDASKINLPNRCMNTQCPVKAPESAP